VLLVRPGLLVLLVVVLTAGRPRASASRRKEIPAALG
jgi:hypothetical protein